MRDRCNNPNSKDYKRYGGRGISISEVWDDFENFQSWSIMNGYSDDLSIDRIDNDRGYGPDNCRWADIFTQNANRRASTVLINGRFLTLKEVSEEFDIKLTTIRNRYYNQGYRDEQLIAPSHQGKKQS
jgi:hypothetical protein